MKKLMVIALCSVFMVVGFASVSMATLIGYLPGNPNEYWADSDPDKGYRYLREALFEDDDSSFSIGTSFLFKVDAPNADQSYNGFGIKDVTYKGGNEIIGGSWFAPSEYTVEYVTIKAGNGFNIYDGVLWETPNDKGLSNIAFWGKGDPGNNPIPEPATVLLLGFGLVGLATVGRRRMKK